MDPIIFKAALVALITITGLFVILARYIHSRPKKASSDECGGWHREWTKWERQIMVVDGDKTLVQWRQCKKCDYKEYERCRVKK